MIQAEFSDGALDLPDGGRELPDQGGREGQWKTSISRVKRSSQEDKEEAPKKTLSGGHPGAGPPMQVSHKGENEGHP